MQPVITWPGATVPDRGRAMGNPNFRRLWGAFSVSSFGSEIAELAVPLLAVITLSASATEVGLVRVAQFLPFLLVTLPFGVLVDRHLHRRLGLMVTADLCRFLLVALIPLSVWAGFAEVELLYAVVFAVGVFTVLYQIADFALLPSVVRPDQLIDANGKIAASQSASEIGGRGFGGLLIQLVSAPAAVALNAVAFLGSALTLRRIRLEPAPVVPAQRGSSRQEVVAGLRIAVRNRYVRALLGEASTFNVFNEMFVLGLLLFGVRELGLGPAAIGLVFTAAGVGSFAGAWFGSRVTRRFGYGRVLLVTLVMGNSAPVFVLLLEYAPGGALAVLCGIYVVMGVGIGIANVHAVSLRQTAVPEALRGRVNAAYRLVSYGAMPLGAFGGGVVASQFGAQAAMMTGAVGIALATLWVAFSPVPRLRRIDECEVAIAGP